MKNSSLRHVAALAAAVMLCTAASTALAHTHRWAPSVDMEDGARVADDDSNGNRQPQYEDRVVPSAATEPAPPAAPPAAEGPARPPKAPLPPTGAPVTIDSPSAILMEAKSGRVLFQKNAHERRNPASVTKIMTLIVAFDAMRDGKVKPEDKVTISDEAAKQIGTIIFADTGETFGLADLLKSVAVGSANDAAVAVGEHVSGSVETFVAAMNAKAKELGMNDTQFMNPTGLSAEGHFTSAYDIATMSRYAALHYPELIRLTSVYGDDLQVPWRKNGPTFRLWNNNKLLTWFDGADGLKTGWTEAAGYCLAATAQRGGLRFISVIMGADTWKKRNAEAAKLLEYGFSNYTSVTLAEAGKPVGMVQVSGGRESKIAAIPRMVFAVSVAKGDQKKVSTETRLTKRVNAPVQAGQVVGEVVALMDGKEVAKMELVTAGAVPKANLWESIGISIKRLFVEPK